ncbi:E3 ubiquitin-protein ligase UHRF1 [Eurytemora carolleeae]|uniref:E3 ubiquitin-protein ligase UHRF1 n=1 Tax=Eurytemora carolleeae TaxID=1294199 RepID=UPI000C76F98D|nr:E3 ubiquitin-protein ligase UHRF1 [Eurytemora carolleeae]|eukprot:XP_023326891.1 E3 ubiquitin-protein ligase UHRF1-like [Eurytemora affinis]
MYINLHLYTGGGEVKKVSMTDLSKNMKVIDLQKRIEAEHGIEVSLQKLIHKGKIMSGNDGETLLHYNANYNETIQVHKREVLGSLDDVNTSEQVVEPEPEKNPEVILEDVESNFYKLGDLVDVKDCGEGSETLGSFFEAKIQRITKNIEAKKESESDGLNYHVVYDRWPLDDTDHRCSNLHLRPRARQELKLGDLEVNQRILVNFNMKDGEKIGEWYEATVTEVNARKKLLICTLYIGVEGTPLDNQVIKYTEKIFKLENPVLVQDRTLQTQKELDRVVPRKHTIECEACEDVEKKKCKECGCNNCGKKKNPETMIICDECQLNFHLQCIGMSELPDDDFYCSNCKRTDTTIKPGDKLINKKLKNAPSQNKDCKRDWGRGFACAGRSTTNDKIPMGHKGQVPGTEVGMTWYRRIQLSENGIHRPPVAGIHASEKLGAMSIVLNGGYEDDVDNGEEFLYTGSGGRDLGGNRRTNVQSFDQELTKGNRGLAMNCNAPVREDGNEAKDWKAGQPVRVVRGYKLKKHSPKYAPEEEGFRYDGIYKVVKYYKEVGQSGLVVWRYVLRRDDPSPAPWTKEGKKIKEERGWSVIYPEGFTAPPLKGGKRKNTEEDKENLNSKKIKFSFSDALKDLIKKDKHNSKVWSQVLKDVFSDHEDMKNRISDTFSCSICMCPPVPPVKLTCKHNMCKGCLGRFSGEDIKKVCPVCRAELTGSEEENSELRAVLNFIIPGYDDVFR